MRGARGVLAETLVPSSDGGGKTSLEDRNRGAPAPRTGSYPVIAAATAKIILANQFQDVL